MKFTYCPKCAGKLDNTFKLEQGGDFVPKCTKCGFLFFQNSKPTGSVVPVDINSNKIMLAKRAVNPSKGKYDIIGGFLQENEDPITGTKREFLEETRYKLDNLKYLNTYIGKYGDQENLIYTFNVTYTCILPTDADLKPNDDIDALGWFDLKQFDMSVLAFEYLSKVISDLQKLYLR